MHYVFCVNTEVREREHVYVCVCVCVCMCVCVCVLKVISLFVGYFAWHILKIVCGHVVLDSNVGIVFKIVQIMSV